LNLALRGLLKPGDRVAISRLEHNAVIRPLETMKAQGVTVEYAPCLENGTPDPDRIPDVEMVITVAASNVSGAVADIGALADSCRAKGISLVVDAAQAAGSIPMPWAAKVSAIAMAGHKGLLGPQGIGLAWFAPGVEPAPLIEGGTGSASESATTPPFWPDRQEAGTPNTPGAAGLLAAMKYIAKRGIADIQRHETQLCAMILEALGNNPMITVYPPKDARLRASLVTFNVKGMDPASVSGLLDAAGVAVRSGLQCAPEAHRFIGTFPAGAVRVSPGPFSSKSDIRYFIDLLFRKIRER
jgi:selenocysteine lyase/cysteine desulfurase